MLYFGVGRGGGIGRVSEGGGEGVVRIYWKFNGYRLNELTRATTAYIGPTTAWQLW